MSERGGGDRDADAVVRTDGSATVRPHQAPPSDDRFGWRGWLLVGALAVAFLVVPVTILYLPAAQDLLASVGLSLRDAYLALPMVPALLLGAIAVWAAVRTRAG